MSERRWSNFSSCCRLCLSDKLDTLKSIFEDVTRGREIVKNIKTSLGVDVFANDQLSTMICTQCLSKVDSWNDFRKSCNENQLKLLGWMNAWSSTGVADISIQIKDEVVEDGDTPPPRQVNIDENGVIHIKSEPIAVCDDPEVIDGYGMPSVENEEEGECDMEQMTAYTITDGVNGLVSDVDPLEVSQNGEGSNCRVCNKVFSTPGNRRKHEYMIHKRTDGSFSKNNENAVELIDDEQNTWNTDESTTGSSSITGNETEKIQFAAGLQLQQRSTQQDENVPLTKVEISYLDKCKTIVKMTETLVCACHAERFTDQKDLFIHLKKMRTWFAMFTCYNCLITFGDRSTYMKHFCACTKPVLENLKRLATTAINPKVKIRLYQSYKCIKCDCIFSFREDYNSHLDEEHLDAAEGPPYACVCSQLFNEIDEYKEHVHVSCFLRYFCDICFGAFTTVDAFKAHCEKEHDSAEGNSLDTYDSYHKGKAPDIIGTSGKRSLPADSKENDNVIKRRRTINLPLSQVDSEDDYIEPNQLNNPQAFRNMKCSKPTACPQCDKLYSSYHNMLRHYKQAHDESGKLLGCMYCSEKFRLISEVKEHEALVHGIESNNSETDSTNMEQYKFSCPVCGSLFKSLDEWKIHTEQHPKKPCDECGKQFMLQSELDQHRSVHLNIKVYRDAKTKDYKSAMISPNLICEICDKTFSDKSELQQHKLLHEKMPVLDAHDDDVVDEKKDLSRKYSCEPCNKHYVSYGGIWDHNKKYHSGQPVASTATEYRKQCDECPKILTSKAAWINHARMHDRMNAQQTTPNVLQDEEDDEFGGRNRPKSRASKTNDDDDDESYYTCKRCFKVFSSKYNLRNHMKSHGIILNPSSNRSSSKTGKIIKTYWCDICHQACPGYAELQEHKQEHRKEKAPTVEEGMEEVERKPLVFCCNICTATFQTNFALKRHKEKHAAEEQMQTKQVYVYCKYCKIAYKTVEELNDHMLNEHEQQPPKVKQPVQKTTAKKFACDVCKKVFDNSGALASHQGWHKRGKYGKKILKSKEKVVRTMLNHTPKSATPTESVEYQCETCYQQFPNDTALQIHILEKHRDVNTTILSMSCNSCKLTFETKSAYDTHIQLHKAVESQRSPKAHPCKYCPAGFSRSDTLNAHVRQHHKEHYHDVFKCNQCERVFDKQNALTIHLKVHERQRLSGDVGPKPNHNKNIYFCSICDVGFVIAKDLRNHVVSAHPF